MNIINGVIHQGLHFVKTKTGRQTFSLFSAKIFVIFLGIVTATLHTRILGPVDYGVLSFFVTITGFTVLFFRFGLFSSGGLLLAQTKGIKKERELIGILLLITLLLGFSYALFIFISSFFIDNIFNTNINNILKIVSPILIILPFQFLITAIGQGTNKIKHIAWFNVIPKTLYVIGILAILALNLIKINVSSLILLNLFTIIVGVGIITYSFKPLFSNLKENLKKIWSKNKEYGIHLYWGQIADQSTYKLDGIFISYFVNIIQLGFYTLAIAITSPMTMLSQSLSMSLFKGFVNKDKIPKKVIYYNFLWLLISVVGLVILGKFIVSLLFTDKFLPVVPLILPLALAGFFQGMYQPYNMFLAAQGKGKWLRNISFIEAMFNIFGNLFFVIYFGVIGIAFASFIAKLLSFGSHMYYYKKYLRGKL